MNPLLFIDATREGDIEHENEYDLTLQRVVATSLNLPLDGVKARWTAINLTETRAIYAGGQYVSSKTTIVREILKVRQYVLQRWQQNLKDMHAIVIVDDAAEGVCSVAGALAVQVAQWTDGNPMIIGVDGSESRGKWYVVDSIPMPLEDEVVSRERLSDFPPPRVGDFVWFRRDVERLGFKALAGMHGQVTDVTDERIAVTRIESVPGDEGQENNITWRKGEEGSVISTLYWYCNVFTGKLVVDLQVGEQILVSADDLETQEGTEPDIAYITTIMQKEALEDGYKFRLWLEPIGPEVSSKFLEANTPFPLDTL